MRQCLGLAALLLCAPLYAAEHVGNLSQAAEDPLLEEGLHALYRMDYSTTRANARAFIRKNPANPLGPLYMSGILWWQATTEAARGGIDPHLLRQFHESVRSTVKISKTLFKSDDVAQRSDGYFAAGIALGLEGQMRLAEGQIFRAYRSGKKAIKYLQKCVKGDPRYYDAYFGLGVFDYQVAVLPGVIKIGARMLLRGTGNAKRGLKRIHLTIDKGRFASRQAAGFLLTLYVLHEKDHEKTLRLLRDLRHDFPDSPYFHFVEVITLHHAGRDAESYIQALTLFNSMRKDSSDWRMKQIGTLCGLYGPNCFNEENLQKAHQWLKMAIVAAETTQSESDWRAYLYMQRGFVRDMLRKRKGALSDYAHVTDLHDFKDSRAWAFRCKNRICTDEDAIRFMTGRSAEY